MSFGASYSADDGLGAAISFSERNFLGRGQRLSFTISTASDDREYAFGFFEPAFLSRDVALSVSGSYSETTEAYNALYDTSDVFISPSLAFPIGENSRLDINGAYEETEISNYTGTSPILSSEAGLGKQSAFSVGVAYNYDTRRSGLDPNTGFRLRLSQDIGFGGDIEFSETSVLAGAQTRVFNEEIGVKAEFEAGMLNVFNGDSRVTDRYFLNGKMRGFEANGQGPRDLDSTAEEALGGNFYAVTRFESEFPLGLPEEYGISGGLFADFGAVWGLDNTDGGRVDDSFNLRSVVGFAILWDSVIGPLRFNFTKALQKEDYDRERTFDLTISTQF